MPTWRYTDLLLVTSFGTLMIYVYRAKPVDLVKWLEYWWHLVVHLATRHRCRWASGGSQVRREQKDGTSETMRAEHHFPSFSSSFQPPPVPRDKFRLRGYQPVFFLVQAGVLVLRNESRHCRAASIHHVNKAWVWVTTCKIPE